MVQRLTGLAVLTLAPALMAFGAQAQEQLFRTWFEAPESVMAGETFQVWLWATYELGAVAVPPDENVPAHLYSVYGSIEVTGDLLTFDRISRILGGLPYHLSLGTPDGSWLWDFAVLQSAYIPGGVVEYQNPLAVAMFEVTTTEATHGDLDIYFRPPSILEVPYVDWWEGSTSDWISTIDPGVGLIAESITVRVIPAPASIAILGLATLAARRRR
ncbi:MAG: hypothetical protein Kow0022_17910 [Phycisphaerales bacterium]